MDTQNTILEHLDISLLQAKHPTIIGDLFAKEVIINNGVLISNLLTNTLNNVDMQKLAAEILTIDGFHIEKPLYFKNVTITNSVNPTFINGIPSKNILHTTDVLENINLSVDGTATFEAPVELHGKLNNITISNKTILLKDGTQFLQGKLKANEINVTHLETPNINHADLKTLEQLSMKPLKLENVESLTVKRLTVAGMLNGVDIGVLDEFALKTHGDQEITGKYIFDNLEVNNLETSQQVTEEFVRIDAGEYWIGYDVHFKNDVSAISATVSDNFNSIGINSKGGLDVFLKNSSELQFIRGFKEIHTVKFGDVKFRGKILSNLLEKINPVRHVKKPIIVEGDFVFTKGVIVEKLLQSEDVVSADGVFSIGRLLQEGLKITDRYIPTTVNLLQATKVSHVNASKINGRNAKSFIVTGTDKVQKISGSKLIQGDFYITGSTEAININNINLKQLEDTTMKIEGNQQLTGKFIFENLSANQVNTIKSYLNHRSWSKVFTNGGDQIVTGNTVFTYLKTDYFETPYLLCDGKINNYSVTKLQEDTVTPEHIINLKGAKHFTNLTIDTLIVEDTTDIQHLTDFVELFENAVISNAEIENLTFSGTCNGMTEQQLNQSWHLRFSHDLYFDNVTILGDLQINSDHINHLKIKDLVEKTVKHDENFHFENAIFGIWF